MLAQKARMNWLKEGDVNTRTFHKAINKRRRNNGILGLELEGEWCEEPRKVKGAIRDFFH